MCVQMRRRNDRYVDNFPKTVRKPIPFERKEKVRERIMEEKGKRWYRNKDQRRMDMRRNMEEDRIVEEEELWEKKEKKKKIRRKPIHSIQEWEIYWSEDGNRFNHKGKSFAGMEDRKMTRIRRDHPGQEEIMRNRKIRYVTISLCDQCTTTRILWIFNWFYHFFRT